MSYEELPFVFQCGCSRLVGIVHKPDNAIKRGVLIIVGGPQYRIGSHRQFILLARFLAENGVTVMRFDYHGMGDSEGRQSSFEEVGTDISRAIDELMIRAPEVKEVILWGLCDAASASLFYAHTDSRVVGTILLNPWVRTEQSMASTYLKHYYLSRLTSKDFWKKLLDRKVDVKDSVMNLINMIKMSKNKNENQKKKEEKLSPEAAEPLPEKMANGLEKFGGKVLIILSGNDLTAAEFIDITKKISKWRRLLKSNNVVIKKMPDANHTFSTREWRDTVAGWTKDWVMSC